MATPTLGNVHIGNGDLWLGGTAPASGSDATDPTAGTPAVINSMTHAFGAPTSGGTYVGFTFGAATLTYRPTYYMVVTEQAFAEVISIPTNEEATLGITALEQTLLNIATAWGQSTTMTAGGVGVAFVGSKPSLDTQPVVLLSRKRTGVGYFLATMYQAYSSDGSAVNFERRAESRLPITLRALADVTRSEGDQLYQLANYPTNPA